MNSKIVFFLFIFASACSHLPKPQTGNTLFPIGTYKHTADIQAHDKHYNARGVLRISEADLHLFALGPMDITAAKIHESFEAQNVSIDITMDDFKKHESTLRRVYPLLRSFLLYARNQESWGLLKAEKFNPQGYPEILSGPRDVKFSVTEFKNNHPTKFKISHPQFSVTLEETP